MPSQQQIAHFQAFGFAVLHGLLHDEETAARTYDRERWPT